MSSLLQGTPQIVAAFAGSSVEAVEAATLVLAAGVVRGWRAALAGTAAGLVTLVLVVTVFGSAIAAIPIGYLQIVVGSALLLFGARWLRKAILRSAGIVAHHDERAIFAEETRALQAAPAPRRRWDPIAMLTAYKAVVLEGIEVVVIVVGVGAGNDMLVPASVGAFAACVCVAVVAVLLNRPLARVPENGLKLAVGVMLTAFGWFWFGEGIGIDWPLGDGVLVVLMALLFAAARIVARVVRQAFAPIGPDAEQAP